MKVYQTDTRIHLVGKGWEIRHLLRQSLKQSDKKLISLQSFLANRQGLRK